MRNNVYVSDDEVEFTEHIPIDRLQSESVRTWNTNSDETSAYPPNAYALPDIAGLNNNDSLPTYSEAKSLPAYRMKNLPENRVSGMDSTLPHIGGDSINSLTSVT